LSQSIHQAFGDVIPMRSYEVDLDENDQLYWTEQVNGSEIRHDQESNTGWFQRAGIFFIDFVHRMAALMGIPCGLPES